MECFKFIYDYKYIVYPYISYSNRSKKKASKQLINKERKKGISLVREKELVDR